ncbi:GntR family transcriptional regulator [Pollutimonas bauzanensis]|uniref:GntR family transcriptional regulator n=1 Tax=Pollutimonas bauzanensis TaxID=658167 RepID=A0A1M5ZJ75_9BURK|nr:GntR family transcriptional regulator [Pollutimonas bauzanensis]SHI24347.1 GntR family transcriptional regulator [Pollutimonas bauzanensis]
MVEINKNSEIPLYLQIADLLTADIKSKRLLPLEKIPTEYELTRIFNVSRVTVRQAIRILVERGLAVSRQGKGVFVTGPVVNQELNELRGFYDSLLAQGYDPETEVLSFDAPEAGARNPLLGHAEYDIYHFKRLYKIDNIVVALADVTLPGCGHRLTRADVERLPVYSLIEQVLKKKVARATTEIRSGRADDQIAQVMGLGDERYLLTMLRTSLDAKGLILETTCFYIQPDVFAFHLEVAGPLQIASSIRRVGHSPALP